LCAQCHLAGTTDLFQPQRCRRTCVAAPRAEVPNTTCAGSAVAASPLIASGLIMLLSGRPCAVGLACAAARALRLADARTLRHSNACPRRWACACARQLRFTRAQRAGGVARRRRLEALFWWSGAVPVPRAELARWCGTVAVTPGRRTIACTWLLRRFSARCRAPQACACSSYRRAEHVSGVLQALSHGWDSMSKLRRTR
jgi:hypothetical protein